MNADIPSDDLDRMRRAFERVSAQGWGLALGVLAAVGLFLATVILVVRGGPNPGPHLALLGVYFPGYSVTWPGAFIGALYALVAGYVAGRATGAIYNRIVSRL